MWRFGSFQFTPLREGRQHELHNGNADEIFQFTPLREGRLSAPPTFCPALLFQFTPLREGRLIVLFCYSLS